MRSSIRTIVTLGLLAVCVALLTGRPAAGQEQQFGNLGDLKLVSGEVLHDCRIGYRTWGKLNADPSNAVLFPMWASGVTAQVAGSVGPGKLLDSSQDYIIAVDPLTNGVSSSPSNSAAQPRMKFPRITVRDMVNSEYRLLTGVLHIRHLKAVLGTSMGGMQTFQWMVTYPDFMDKAVPIVGSPQLAPYDLLLWQTQIDAITHDSGWRNGDYTEQPARRVRAEIGPLVLTTPQAYNQRTRRGDVLPQIDRAAAESPVFDANDDVRQMQAIMSLDVSDAFGGSLERAAAAVKARVLVIVSKSDHVVTPGPALAFAKLVHAEVLELDDDCGHLASVCDGPRIDAAVREFLR